MDAIIVAKREDEKQNSHASTQKKGKDGSEKKGEWLSSTTDL